MKCEVCKQNNDATPIVIDTHTINACERCKENILEDLFSSLKFGCTRITTSGKTSKYLYQDIMFLTGVARIWLKILERDNEVRNVSTAAIKCETENDLNL